MKRTTIFSMVALVVLCSPIMGQSQWMNADYLAKGMKLKDADGKLVSIKSVEKLAETRKSTT